MAEPSSAYVVLGDVIASRSIEDRQSFRDRLTTVLARINTHHEAAIAAPFEVLKGVDEFGGVLCQLAPVYELLATILDELHPVGVRFAVAGGGIDVGRFDEGIAALDGAAFHRADQVIERLAETELYAGVATGSSADPLVATTINLLMIRREQRTARQREVIQAYERHGTQVAAAEELGIPQQAVSQTLDRADYYRLRAIRDRLQEALATLYD